MSRLPVRPFTVFLTLAVLVLLVSTLSLGPVSREAPLWAVGATLALAVLQLLIEAVPSLAARLSALQADSLFGASRHLDAWRKGEARSRQTGRRALRAIRITLWVTGFAALVYAVGFGPAVPIFLLPYLRTEGGLGWKGSILVTLGVAGGLHLISTVFLGLDLPGGAFV